MSQPIRLLRFFALGALALACRSPLGSDARPIPIAVVPFGVVSGSAPHVDVAEVIRTELASRGRFALLETSELPARPTRLREVRFEDWQRADADYLVLGVVARVHDGGHEVEFRLIDVRAQTTLLAFLVPSAPEALHGTALEIAGMIGQRLEPPSAHAGPG